LNWAGLHVNVRKHRAFRLSYPWPCQDNARPRTGAGRRVCSVRLESLTYDLLRPLNEERALGPMQMRLVAAPKFDPNDEWMD